MAFNRSLLHEERIKRGLNTYQLAEKVGVSQGTISKWEIGATTPRGKSLDKLCAYFEVEPEYWDHFYHEPQKPLESFRPSDEAKKAYKQAVDPYKADKEKVRDNIEKLNKINSFADAMRNVSKAVIGDEIDNKAYKAAAAQVISDLEKEIRGKDTEIQGLKCELEGLRVENARLQGNIEGLSSKLLLGDNDMKESFWKRIFG